ncbi:hypothetical protein [Vibrio vulnificus]|uniref:hypothetical protein n=1 Tax=Vibrio vulnificus TaxID=672 RepID=UPI002111AAFE|nr:hypothetical protein [Vibrio vulnificus]
MTIDIERKFEESLSRLKRGKASLVKNHTKITVTKVCVEAGFDKSYIHSKVNRKLKEKYKAKIDEHYKDLESGVSSFYTEYTPKSDSASKLEKLRAEREYEKGLKVKYREESEESLAVSEASIAKLAIMAHRVFELEAKEMKANSLNILAYNSTLKDSDE